MALANKYRPKSFSEVIGQDNAVLALRNIIKNKTFIMAIFFQELEVLEKLPLEDFSLKPSIVQTMTKKMVNPCGVCSNCVEIQKTLILT